MTEDHIRPDPDELLARVNQEEQQQARGRLKIFLGYVAGVGKTFAMLEAAHQRMAEGVDVVVAYIETHGRAETEALLDGLEVLPRSKLEYRGTQLEEMDLDGILARHPHLALVDELAHTNAPGSRHPRRSQDVEEILAAGIDVYTTLNIQHLESLNDVVQQITGIIVHETVPDSVIDNASEIETVDLPVDELIHRLRDGKVYVPEQAQHALEQFFRKGNLTALRELSLRRAADRVNHQMLDYMQVKSIPGPWAAGERILVCISSHPMGERLVRAGRRLADDLKAGWAVMFVETPGHHAMPAKNRERVERNLQLARELGAQVITARGESVAAEVIRYSHQHNITKIIAGKPLRPRWYELLRGTVIDQIIRASGSIDVYVVSEEKSSPEKIAAQPLRFQTPLIGYVMSLLIVVILTLVGLPLHTMIDATNLVMLYLLGVVLAAVFLGRGPSILVSVAGVLAFDFFFTSPRFSFSVYDTQYLLTFAGLLVVGIIISQSASMLRSQVDALRLKDQQTTALNRFSRELTGAVDLGQVLDVVLHNTVDLFQRDAAVLLPENSRLAAAASSPGFDLTETGLAAAEWAFKNGQPSGQGTATLSAAPVHIQPLATSHGIVGVLGLRLPDHATDFTPDQRMLLEGFANLSALAIERASFAEKAAQSEMLRRTEQLQTALLNSISHELRTPLASIMGVLSSLGESENAENPANRLDAQTRIELIESADQQAHRLNRLVENLLDMTRLEAGALRLNLEPVEIREFVATVVTQFSVKLRQHPIQVYIPRDMPLVTLDAVLIAQVLLNLLDNACKYSPAGSPIEVKVTSNDESVIFSVRDFGIGIPSQDLERVFDKFYRVQHNRQSVGTGLGLSICKGIVEAHRGRIWAENNPDRGARIVFAIPVNYD